MPWLLGQTYTLFLYLLSSLHASFYHRPKFLQIPSLTCYDGHLLNNNNNYLFSRKNCLEYASPASSLIALTRAFCRSRGTMATLTNRFIWKIIIHAKRFMTSRYQVTEFIHFSSLTWRPGGRDCFSFSAFSLSVIFSV